MTQLRESLPKNTIVRLCFLVLLQCFILLRSLSPTFPLSFLLNAESFLNAMMDKNTVLKLLI